MSMSQPFFYSVEINTLVHQPTGCSMSQSMLDELTIILVTDLPSSVGSFERKWVIDSHGFALLCFVFIGFIMRINGGEYNA
jgi:hypothetical protein